MTFKKFAKKLLINKRKIKIQFHITYATIRRFATSLKNQFSVAKCGFSPCG